MVNLSSRFVVKKEAKEKYDYGTVIYCDAVEVLFYYDEYVIFTRWTDGTIHRESLPTSDWDVVDIHSNDW